MTKNSITKFVQSLGGSTRYSGKEKTMYIKGSGLKSKVEKEFPNVPFALKFS